MARSKKKTAEKKTDWRRMLEIEPLVTELVSKHHAHLERAKIAVLGKPKASTVHGKTNVAKAKRATTALRTLLKEFGGEDVHYVIEIGLDAWEKLESKTRRAVLDHELSHFTGEDLDTGKWGLVGHDVQEFTAILRRHGAYTAELQLFAREAKQLPLNL